MDKQTLFISYCWKDGNTYADELESQLNDAFDVKRDKSQLIANDDIYDFMNEIANCDNVVIVLTAEYVKSLNCMLEMSCLASQDDWAMKAMVLVIDDTLYGIERKLEVINYWILRRKMNCESLNSTCIGQSILDEEKEYVDQICNQVEGFLKGISRRKNPSQIAIVNEIIKKSQRSKSPEKELMRKGEKEVLEFLSENGHMTIKELCEKSGRSQVSAKRFVSNLAREGVIERQGAAKNGYWVVKNKTE